MGNVRKLVQNLIAYNCKQNYLNNFSNTQTRGITINGKRDELQSGKTIPELKVTLRRLLGVEKGYKALPKSREHLNKYLAKDQNDLPPRTIADSFLYGYIPLSKDVNMQDKYVRSNGSIRSGRLMEDLDIFAVMVFLKYIHLPNLPDDTPIPTCLVTALCNGLRFTDQALKPTADIRVSGYVSSIGKSSSTIEIFFEQQMGDLWLKITQATLYMVARDATNTKATAVNPLKVQSKLDERIVQLAMKNRETTKLAAKQSPAKALPTPEEQQKIHSLYTKMCGDNLFCECPLPAGFRWIKDTSVGHTVYSFPEDRNLHNTVFGGYVMRLCIELAYATCTLHCNKFPRLVGVSEITFNQPIDVGSIIMLTACVVYAQANYAQIHVCVHAYSRITVGTQEKINNIVHLTFELPDFVDGVIPYTYREAMMYVQGFRHFHSILNSDDEDFPNPFILDGNKK